MSFQYKRKNGETVEIVSIQNTCPDYYQWGKNCANLYLSEEDARKALGSASGVAPDRDLFWEGYLSVKP